MRKVSIGLGAIAAICAFAAPASSALAAQTLTIAPKITGKLGGPGKITFGFTIASTTGGIPSPLAGPFVEKIPKGIKLAGSGFPVCPYTTITAASSSIPPTCPAGSALGSGTATVQAQIGTTHLVENSVVKAYLIGASPVSIGFWGNGTTPIAQTVFFKGSLNPTGSPFSYVMNTLTPVIPTVPGGPNASTTAFSITLGSTLKKGKKTLSTITLPKKCKGKLQWAASDSYVDGSSNSTTATTSCP